MAHKKTPENSSNLAGGEFTGADEARLLDERITRYGVAHTRSQAMLEHLRKTPSEATIKTAASLASCGNYLHFREYFTVGKVRLHSDVLQAAPGLSVVRHSPRCQGSWGLLDPLAGDPGGTPGSAALSPDPNSQKRAGS